MAGLLRFLLGVAGLPLAWGLTGACGAVFRGMPVFEDARFPLGDVSFLVGFVLCFVLLLVCQPVRLYVLGHELTHALWGLVFGARVSNLRVGLRGGSATLTKSHVLITLAPSFFPFYTFLVILAALVARCFVSPLPAVPAWLSAVGATWCFHLFFTLRSLGQRQSDVEEYGRVFSYVFIWIFNVAGVAVALTAASGLAWGTCGRLVAGHVQAAYAFVGTAGIWLYECLRTLSVLQG